MHILYCYDDKWNADHWNCNEINLAVLTLLCLGCIRRIKLRYMMLFLLYSLCSELKAESPLDHPFLLIGAVDAQYNIVNLDAYNELVRMINKNFEKIIPDQKDSITNVSKIVLTSNGLLVVSEINRVHSLKDLRTQFDETKYINLAKNNICKKHDLLESEVFKKTTRGNIVYQINDLKDDFLKSYTFNYKECL
jgi:hypothetical protein